MAENIRIFLRKAACIVFIISALWGCKTYNASTTVADDPRPDKISPRQVFDAIKAGGTLPSAGAQATARFDAAWSAFVAKYAATTMFTVEQIETVGNDMVPTIRALVAMADAEGITQYSQIKKTPRTAKTPQRQRTVKTQPVSAADQRGIEIPPNAMAQWTIKGNCMDPDRPAPGSGDKFQLAPIETLIDSRLVPVYQGFIKLTAHDREAQQYQQQIVWAFRTITKENSYASSMGPKQKAILNRSYPNGAEIFEQVRSSEASKAMAMDTLRKLLPSISVLGQSHNLADLLNPEKAPQIAEAHLNSLIAMKPSEAIQDTGFEYSEIQDGVYAHVVGASTLTTSIAIVNTTPSTFYFQPALYAAEPQRKVQRVTLTTPPSVQLTQLPAAQNSGGVNDALDTLETFFNPRLDAAWKSLQRDKACLGRILTHTGYEVIRLALEIRGSGLSYIALGLDWLTAVTGYDPVRGEKLNTQDQALAYSSAYMGLEAFIPDKYNHGPLQKINVLSRMKAYLHDIPMSAATSMLYCQMVMQRRISPEQKLSDAQVRQLADMAHFLD